MRGKSLPAYRYRRFLQFRLRTILLLFLVASLVMSAWHRYLQSYREQRKAVQAVAHHSPYAAFEPGQPAWLRHFADEATFKDVVHLSLQSKWRFRDEDLQHLAKMPRLRRLSLHNTRITDEGLRHLSSLKELDTLSLESTRISDEGLQHLAGLSKLRMLQLNRTSVTGQGLRHLAELRSLERLEIATAPLSDEDTNYLAQLPELRALQLSGSGLTFKGFDAVNRLPKLEELTIHPYDRQPLKVRLHDLTRLKRLTFRAGRNPTELELQRLPRLSELHLGVLDLQRLKLQGLTSLTWLDLSRRPIAPQVLEAVTKLPSLQVLRLSSCDVQHDAWQHLAQARGIRELYLESTSIDDDGLQYLQGLAQLKQLSLAGTQVEGDGLRHLAGMSQLMMLDLGDTNIPDADLARSSARGNLRKSALFASVFVPDRGIEELAAIESLEHLNVNGTNFVLDELLLLSKLPKLSYLAVDREQVSETEWRILEKHLPGTTVSRTSPSRADFPRWRNRRVVRSQLILPQ